MTIVRLADGGLWVDSPTELPPPLGSEVEALGRVRYLIAPNCIDYWLAEEWVAVYPDAMTYAAPGVQEQARSHGRFAGYHAGNARFAGLREFLPNDVSYRSPVFGRT